MTEEISTEAKKLQQECHNLIDFLAREKKVTYQDATNIFMFSKLAELSLEIKKLKGGVK